jgi:hypothetical protein
VYIRIILKSEKWCVEWITQAQDKEKLWWPLLSMAMNLSVSKIGWKFLDLLSDYQLLQNTSDR